MTPGGLCRNRLRIRRPVPTFFARLAGRRGTADASHGVRVAGRDPRSDSRKIALASGHGGTASIFVHDLAPPARSGAVPIRIGDDSAPSAGLEYCERRGALVTASDVAIAIAGNARKTVSGSLRFSVDGSRPREQRVTLEIVEPSPQRMCG